MTITYVKLNSPNTQTNAPYTFGVAFKRGDVPTSFTLDSTSYQVVVKRRWNDGSVKTAIVSGRADTTANVPTTLSISQGTPPTGTALIHSDIVAAAPSASIQCGSLGTVALSNLLAASPFRTWVSGPQMVECHYRADIAGTLLAAWFHVRLFAGGRVWVRAFVENGYLDNGAGAAATNADQSYIPTITIGGTVVYNNGAASLTHIKNGAVMAEGWIGGDPQITPQHDVAYLRASKLVPNYSTSNPNATTLNALIQTYTPMAVGAIPFAMGSGGANPSIAILPNWNATYLGSGDKRAYNAVLSSSSAMRSFGICFRDNTTKDIIKPSSFANWSLGGPGGTGDAGTNRSNGANWEINHHPGEGYLAYLLTGDYWHYETMLLQLSMIYVMRGTGSTGPVSHGTGTSRIIVHETRGTAWSIRSMSQFCAVAPDEFLSAGGIAAEYRTLLASNMTYWKNVTQTPGINGLGYLFEYTLTGYGAGWNAPWQQYWWIQSQGFGSDIEPLADMTNYLVVRDWMYKGIVGPLGPVATGFPYQAAGIYEAQISNGTSLDPTTWVADWRTVATLSFANVSGGVNGLTDTNTLYPVGDMHVSAGHPTADPYPLTTPGTAGDVSQASYGRWGYLLPAIAYAAEHGAAGAAAAWARITGASNYATLASNFDQNSQWGVFPRSVGGASVVGIGTTTRVGNGDWISGKTVVGQRGLGILAQNIPSTGTNGAALAFNDLSFPADNDKEVRIEIITPPASGTLFLYEDTSGYYTGANNTTASLTYKLWVMGADMGNATVTFNTGVLDTAVPVMQGVLASSAITTSGFALSWSAATDNVGVVGYEVSVDNGATYTPIGNVLTITETSLAPGTVYNCKVRAYDAANNKAVPLSLAVSTAATPDSAAPTMNGSLTISNITSSGFTVNWLAASDNVAVTGYRVSTNNGASYTNVGNVLSYDVTGLSASTLYNIKVVAYDAVPNTSAALSTTATTNAVNDTVGPTLGGFLAITGTTTGGFTASWQAATDNVGVTGYEISVDNGTPSYISVGNVLTSTKTGLSAATTYNVRVRAFDAAGNRSAAITTTVTTATPGTYATTCTITFQDRNGNLRANLTGLKWAFFDQALPNLLQAPKAYGINGSTNASGVAVFNITGTTLSPGGTGWLIVSNSDGTSTQSNLISFAGPVVVA